MKRVQWDRVVSLTFQETDVCPARQMREGVYYYLCYAVGFQLLPVGCLVIKGHDSRDASLPEPELGSLVRNDKLERHRAPSRPPDHHRVEVDVDRPPDAGVREREIRSTIHNKAAPVFLPDHFPQTPAVDAGDFHSDSEGWIYWPKNEPDLSYWRRRASEESRARVLLHVLQGNSGRPVLCEWDLRRVTSRTIYGLR